MRSLFLRPALVLGIAGLLFGTSCNFVGPRGIRGARQSYNEAIIETWNEQLLLNLVRLRYRDTPFFLQVGSVTTQYEIRGSAGTSLLVDPFGTGDDELQGSVGFDYNEQPTVTYSPLTGEAFVRQLLAPISLDSLVLLSSAGWSIERVLRLTVNRMNGLLNAPSATGPTPTRAPEHEAFTKTARALRELQERRALVVEILRRNDELALEVVLDPKDVDESDTRIVRESLGLDPTRNRYPIDSVAGDPAAVVLVTRSLLGVLYYLSQGVRVPEDDAADGRVTITEADDGGDFDWSTVLGDMFEVRASEDRPDDAFVAVFHRGYWFYIDDRDLASKSTFGLLAQLFNLQSGTTSTTSPLLTIPLGG